MTGESVKYRLFTINDYDAAYALWEQDPSIGLSKADDRESIIRFLEQNPYMSMAAVEGSSLAGTLLAGSDGRRGYLYHLYVAPAYRRMGVAGELVKRAVRALKESGITRIHMFIFSDNHTGRAFWSQAGFRERDDITVCTYDTD